MNDILKEKFNFWLFQVVGWLIYAGSNYLLFFIITKTKTQTNIGFIIRMLLGFTITSILRYIYKNFVNYGFITKKIVLLLSIASIISAVIWQVGSKYIKAAVNYQNPIAVILNIRLVNLFMDLYWDIVLIAAWSTLYFGIKLWISYNHLKQKTYETNLLSKKTEIKVLQSQLNPHFLFNSLNSIRALIKEDKDTAKAMIDKLSALLNYVFANNKKITSKISEEIDIIQNYLAIEKIRFEEKLETSVEIGKGTNDLEILTFLIHPLVENAIKHGMKTTKLPLQIKIFTKKLNENGIIISVQNSGYYIENKNNGIGLENIKLRLENAYPHNHKFTILEENGFVKVEIIINNLKLFLNEN